MLGSILALISARMFALNTTALRRGVLTAPVHQAIAITVPLGLPLFFIILLMFDCFDLLKDLSMKSIFFFSFFYNLNNFTQLNFLRHFSGFFKFNKIIFSLFTNDYLIWDTY